MFYQLENVINESLGHKNLLLDTNIITLAGLETEI